MTSLRRLQDPSLRFLLWFEWILLGLTAVGEILQRFELFEVRLPLVSLACVVLLGLLGLRLPQGKLAGKLGYAALNLGLVLLASVVGRIQFFFLLCVVLMMRSGPIFNQQGRWLTMATLFVFFMLVQGYRVRLLSRHHLLDSLKSVPANTVIPLILTVVLLFALTLIFLQLLMTALLAERNSREQLANANAQLRHYALKVEEVTILQERTRVAREIHDAIGHSLTVLNLNLNAALGLWEQEPKEAKCLIGEAKALSQTALQDVRQSVTTLRATPLQGKTLDELVQALAVKLQQTTSILPNCTVQISLPIPEALKVAAYRIVQEALTNITRYAQATRVQVKVQTEAASLAIAIQDNGQGFDRTQTTSGFGLRGMEERVLALGGTLDLDTAPGQGCRIVARLPLKG